MAKKKSTVDKMSVGAMSVVGTMSDAAKGHAIDKETPVSSLWAVVRVPTHL